MVLYLVFGVIAFGFGVLVYYFMPRALLTLDLGNMSRVFMVTLMALLFGACLLAYNLQPLVQDLLTIFYTYFETAGMKLLVRQNLTQHRGNSKLTALVYSIGFASIIFIVTS